RRRALESFEIMTAGMHAPVVRLSKSLREIHFGDFENLTWEELPADFQRHYEASLSDPMSLKCPGDESFRETCYRVSAGALVCLACDLEDADIAILGHQGSLRLWRMMEGDLPPRAFVDETAVLGACRRLTMDVAQIAACRRKY